MITVVVLYFMIGFNLILVGDLLTGGKMIINLYKQHSATVITLGLIISMLIWPYYFTKGIIIGLKQK